LFIDLSPSDYASTREIVGDLPHVSGYLRALRYLPPVKLTATEILLKVALKTTTQPTLEKCMKPEAQVLFLMLSLFIIV
jgi:hypothetical protein